MTVWKVWSRFDFGQHKVAFPSRHAAELWVRSQVRDTRFSYERLLEEEMLGYRQVTMSLKEKV